MLHTVWSCENGQQLIQVYSANFIASGKTSLSASLDSGQAGFAKAHPHPKFKEKKSKSKDNDSKFKMRGKTKRKDMTETKVMRHWSIKLPLRNDGDPHNRLDHIPSNGSHDERNSLSLEEYQWISPENVENFKTFYEDLRKWDQEQDENRYDVVQIFDTGGHKQYTMSTEICVTPKSLCAIVFNANLYKSHKLYYPFVGCYVDIILTQTFDVSILLIASHDDECSTFLRETHGKRDNLKQVYVMVRNHILQRAKEADKETRTKLVHCDRYKVFPLSNKPYDNYLTKTQSVILSVIRDIMHHKDILNINAGKGTGSNEPGLWRLYHEKLIDSCKSKNYIYPRSDAIQLFYKFYREIYDDKGNSPCLAENQRSEIDIIDHLMKLYQLWISSKPKGKEKRDSDTKNSAQKIETDNHYQMDNIAEGNDPNIKVEPDNYMESEYSSETESNDSEADRIEEDAELALIHLCRSGEISSFRNYEDYLFPCPNALINTCKVFLDHKEDFRMENKNFLNRMKLIYPGGINRDTHELLLKNGVIQYNKIQTLYEKCMNRAGSDEMFVDLWDFIPLLMAKGMAKLFRCDNTGKDEICPEDFHTLNPLISKEDEDLYIMIPSLIINDVKSFFKEKKFQGRYDAELQRQVYDAKELYQLYMHSEFKIQFTFGDRECFASINLMDRFMIQLFEEKQWTARLLKKCRIFKDKIEKRATGIVGILEVDEGNNKMLTVFEEEFCRIGNDGSIENKRIIRVFADQKGDWNRELDRAMKKATNNVNPDMKAPEPEVSSITRFSSP